MTTSPQEPGGPEPAHGYILRGGAYDGWTARSGGPVPVETLESVTMTGKRNSVERYKSTGRRDEQHPDLARFDLAE
jgi:hypothetical protein